MRAVACRLCGVATDRRHARRRTFAGLGYADTAGTPKADYTVGVCDECESLRPDEPGATVRAALRLVGVEETGWAELVDAFGEAELEAVEYDRVGLPQGGRGRRGPQPEAWGHVDGSQRAALRAAYLRYRQQLRSRPARGSVKTAPPSGPPGCLLCGVGASLDWRRVLTGALTRGPELVEGCLCAACASVHHTVGAIGPTLVERACQEALGLGAGFSMPGLRAWVATGRAPGEPWEWVPVGQPEPDDLQRRVDELVAAVAAIVDRVAALEARVP